MQAVILQGLAASRDNSSRAATTAANSNNTLGGLALQWDSLSGRRDGIRQLVERSLRTNAHGCVCLIPFVRGGALYLILGELAYHAMPAHSARRQRLLLNCVLWSIVVFRRRPLTRAGKPLPLEYNNFVSDTYISAHVHHDDAEDSERGMMLVTSMVPQLGLHTQQCRFEGNL